MVVQFADDTTLLFSEASTSFVEEYSFFVSNNCNQYVNYLDLKLFPIKFLKFLSTSDCRSHSAAMLADIMLEEEYTSKFLGTNLDLGLA